MIKRLFTGLMMFTLMALPPIVLLLLLSTTIVRAADLHDWYTHLLFEPTPLQLQQNNRDGYGSTLASVISR
jgi:hypothetical protein